MPSDPKSTWRNNANPNPKNVASDQANSDRQVIEQGFKDIA